MASEEYCTFADLWATAALSDRVTIPESRRLRRQRFKPEYVSGFLIGAIRAMLDPSLAIPASSPLYQQTSISLIHWHAK